MSFITAHWMAALAVVYALLNILNGLLKDSSAKTIVGDLMDIVAVLKRSDAPGTLKPPFSRSSCRGLPVPHASLLPFVAIGFALALPGCPGCTNVPTKVQWKTAGIDSAKCLVPGVVDAAGDALITLLDQAAGDQVDYQQLGVNIAKKYGVNAAICAVGKLWADLGGAPVFGQDARVAVAVGWLVQHQDQWAK